MGLQIIHIVLGKANPYRMNGVNKVVNSLATYQTKLGYDVVVWGITMDPIHNYPERNYKTVLFQDYSVKFKISEELEEAIKKNRKDTIYHFHGGFIPQFYKVAKVIKKHKQQYFFTPHGAYNTVALKRSNWKKKIYINFFESYVVKKAKKIHFIGESEVEGCKKVFGFVPHCVIPNGQNLEELYFEKELMKLPDKIVFGFVGRLDIVTKGLDILLEAFAQFQRNARLTPELWMIGGGEELSKLQSMAEALGITDYVKFLGPKYGEDKLSLMTAMDYMCLNSRNEGLPGVVLEASGLGVPCIVSKETNMGQYITMSHSGFCLDENTPQNLAMALGKAETAKLNEEIDLLAENAKKMVTEYFNWEHIAQQLVKEYAA